MQKVRLKNFYCISLEFFLIHGRLCRDSIVSIVTSYVFDGPRFEPLWEQEIFSFPYLSRLALRAQPASVAVSTGTLSQE